MSSRPVPSVQMMQSCGNPREYLVGLFETVVGLGPQSVLPIRCIAQVGGMEESKVPDGMELLQCMGRLVAGLPDSSARAAIGGGYSADFMGTLSQCMLDGGRRVLQDGRMRTPRWLEGAQQNTDSFSHRSGLLALLFAAGAARVLQRNPNGPIIPANVPTLRSLAIGVPKEVIASNDKVGVGTVQRRIGQYYDEFADLADTIQVGRGQSFDKVTMLGSYCAAQMVPTQIRRPKMPDQLRPAS